MIVEGGCYCGELRYISRGEPQASIQCHCRECQYITGGNPNVIMIMPLDDFNFTNIQKRLCAPMNILPGYIIHFNDPDELRIIITPSSCKEEY